MDQFDRGFLARRQREEVARERVAEADRAREQERLLGRSRGRAVDRRVLAAFIVVVLLVVLVVTILAWSAGPAAEDPEATTAIARSPATELSVASWVPTGYTLGANAREVGVTT